MSALGAKADIRFGNCNILAPQINRVIAVPRRIRSLVYLGNSDIVIDNPFRTHFGIAGLGYPTAYRAH